MSSLYEKKRNTLFRECINELKDLVLLVGEYFIDDERDSNLEDLNNLAKEYHKDETRYNLSKRALDLTADYYYNDENDQTVSVDDIYKKNLENNVTCIVPFEQHPDMKKILDAIQHVISKPNTVDDIVESDVAVDDIVENDVAVDDILESDVAVDDINASIVVTQVSQVSLDPITKMQIQNPWRNKVCGHVYEYVSIMKYIKSRKTKIRSCPYVGCSNGNIKNTDLVKDTLALNGNMQTNVNTPQRTIDLDD